MAAFNGNSYIQRIGFDTSFESIDLVFMSNRADGILLYTGKRSTEEFFGIKIENNYIHIVMSINKNYQVLM